MHKLTGFLEKLLGDIKEKDNFNDYLRDLEKIIQRNINENLQLKFQFYVKNLIIFFKGKKLIENDDYETCDKRHFFDIIENYDDNIDYNYYGFLSRVGWPSNVSIASIRNELNGELIEFKTEALEDSFYVLK